MKEWISELNSAWAGSPLDISYRSATFPINSCQFIHLPGFRGPLRVFDGVNSDKYEFVGDFKNGICAIRLNSGTKENSGVAKVQVTHENKDDVETADLNVTVSYLQLTSTSAFDFKEYKQIDFNCTAHGVSPPPILELLLGKFDKESIISLLISI
jgi:hypothetical protein